MDCLQKDGGTAVIAHPQPCPDGGGKGTEQVIDLSEKACNRVLEYDHYQLAVNSIILEHAD